MERKEEICPVGRIFFSWLFNIQVGSSGHKIFSLSPGTLRIIHFPQSALRVVTSHTRIPGAHKKISFPLISHGGGCGSLRCRDGICSLIPLPRKQACPSCWDVHFWWQQERTKRLKGNSRHGCRLLLACGPNQGNSHWLAKAYHVPLPASVGQDVHVPTEGTMVRMYNHPTRRGGVTHREWSYNLYSSLVKKSRMLTFFPHSSGLSHSQHRGELLELLVYSTQECGSTWCRTLWTKTKTGCSPSLWCSFAKMGEAK